GIDPAAVAGPGCYLGSLPLLGAVLLGGGGADSLRGLERHAEQTVFVAQHQVARLDRHAIERDRHVDLSRAVLVRTTVRDTGGKDRKIMGSDVSVVAHRTVDHHAAEAAPCRVHQHQLTHDRVRQIAAGVDHYHVAWLGIVDRLMHHEVVAGAGAHRHGRSGHHPAGVHRSQACASGRHPRHHVGNVGDRQLPELTHQVGADGAPAFQNSEPQHRFSLGQRPVGLIFALPPLVTTGAELMEIGVFLPIGNNGWLISTTSPQYMPTFDLNRQVVEKAERYGMDFAMSMIKLRGFGGKSEYWDHNLESLTLMSGLAAVTERIRLIATVAVLTMPPPIVARMVSTMDSISRGRCGLNIVSGWQRAEYEQMGIWPGEAHYTRRYEYCA